jgi:hypothetical protein
MPDLYTISELVPIIGHNKDRIAHATVAYGIMPVKRAGLVKLFAADQIQQIKGACQRVAARSVRP